MSMNIPYGMYPQYNATDLGNDFMAQQYLAQQNPQYMQNQMFAGYQQPQADTFQQGGSSIGSGLGLGLVAGGATGTGMWFLGTNPMKDGKVADGLIKAYDKIETANAKNNALKNLINEKMNPIFTQHGVANAESYEAVEKLAKAGKLEDLADDLKAKLPNDIDTPEKARGIVEKVKPEIEKLDALKLDKEAQRIANKSSLVYQKQQLANLNNVKAKITGLADGATEADIAKFIKENAETFGLKGEEAKIAENAEKLAGKLDTKAKLLAKYEEKITNITQNVNRLTTSAETAIKRNLAEGGKGLIENAEKSVAKAFKNFKWNRVLKGGGIAAAAGLLLGCIFGGSK